MTQVLAKSQGASPERTPLSADEPRTLVEIYERVAREHSKPDILNYKREGVWRPLSTDGMLRRSRSIALGLYALGVHKGDRVAILSESCLEWVLSDQGCIFAGAITVPIYPTLSAEQVNTSSMIAKRALFLFPMLRSWPKSKQHLSRA